MILLFSRTRKLIQTIAVCVLLLAPAMSSGAQEVSRHNRNLDFAQVTEARLTQNAGGSWTAAVTVRHRDEGWDHYANIWQILDADSKEVLGERILAHPHDNEQPFTRSLSGINIPGNTRRLLIRARCNLHDYEGRQLRIDLAVAETDDYQLIR